MPNHARVIPDDQEHASVNRRMMLGCLAASGAGVGLASSFLLLWIYAWCMVDPAQPDYYSAKLQFMLQMPNPGNGTVLGLIGLACGTLLLACAGQFAYLTRAKHRTTP